jgi:hypothetical protein
VNYSGDLPFAAASGGTMTTDTNITFPQNTSTSVDWQTATHWGLIVNIGGTDRLIVWGAFVTPVASPPYHAVMIKIGDLTIEAL